MQASERIISNVSAKGRMLYCCEVKFVTFERNSLFPSSALLVIFVLACRKGRCGNSFYTNKNCLLTEYVPLDGTEVAHDHRRCQVTVDEIIDPTTNWTSFCSLSA